MMKTNSNAAAAFLLCTIGLVQAQEKDSATSKKLDEVVMVGTRAAPRSSVSTPLPIDNIDAAIIQSSGHSSVGQALQYRIPSFNSTSAAVQDATSLLDPFEIRNMGSSRTLVLINGKRKNQSSLIFTQNTIGKGETGADLSSIPSIAIKKIEILRDGASAQYGSDAIAGVINILLKDKINFTEANANLGLYSKGDGFSQNFNLITGSTFKNGGFLTFSTNFQNNDYAYRNGKVNSYWETQTFGANQNEVEAYLAQYPDAQNKNAYPKKNSISFLVNTSIPVSERSSLYANASLAVKKVSSFANHRTPYWVSPKNALNSPDGFTPTFIGDLTDYGATLGYKTKTESDWNIDLSTTFGGNKILYTVGNTFNAALGASSPINFKPGGFRFNNIIGNIDVSKRLSDHVALAFGSEARRDEYEIYAGDPASYNQTGSISFPGLSQENSGVFSRYNIGVYADAAFDISEATTFNATARFENFSDFGNALVWKVSARQNIIGKKLVARGSVSTGFRAPSLQQVYLSTIQNVFNNGKIVSEGLFNNVGKEAKAIGIPKLDAEKSLNFTLGLGIQPNKNFSITLDGYLIKVYDRILLSSRMSDKATILDPLSSIGVTTVNAASFFTNGVDTRTIGLDLVANYRNIDLATGKLALNLAMNMNQSKITKNSDKLNGLNLVAPFNRTEEALATTSRPSLKAVLGIDYAIKKWNISLNNTLFGKATYANSGMPGANLAWNDPAADSQSYLRFKPRITTDLTINYNINSKNTINIGVLNIFNILPKWELRNLPADKAYDEVYNTVTFNGRYQQSSYDAQHFSIFGTQFILGYNIKF
ncbi:TonB-dependent siderophore receptor [Chryseobacterium sp. BIGb0232]|uniref:TonB-dependent receptor plug domain-containing protein n=1 Tax=Chryseobacterium sp. BIGb0232 TaxID=2940598 RepID=UPI000F4773C9|nr:TonB-dependent receptor [Chryseobacterium sp. BIGb0232]MCS4305178.1 iron complex outermembrane receptor protein [Chryseobacterium sp. BIGb0232]ROS07674.1 iron complex outermembrane receptor protein [Chryseobacterium nakagawai]